jgi:glycosyltransferase involved in cell wall biosynthesis
MKILISFIPPVFPIHNHGGSTKILKNIAIYLAERGDEVTIVCNKRFDNRDVFYLYPKVKVMPIFRFKETYPNPYLAPPFYLSDNINILYELAKKHDLLFIFDTDFIFTDFLPSNLPILYSLRDYIYSEALQGSFLIRRGNVVVNSRFVKDSLLATVGRFYPELKKRTILISNGVDTGLFRRTKTSKIVDYVSLKKEDYPIVLFPHRPEEHKGISQALLLMEKLVHKKGYKKAKLLIARGVDEKIDMEVQKLYGNVLNEADRLGIKANIIFHPWIPPEVMPEYYSLGTVTVCIGNIIEAFSNSTMESLSCGTPVIASKVGSNRSILPDWCLMKVDYGDIDLAVEKICSLIKNPALVDMSKVRKYIKKNFSLKKMCQAYYDIIHTQKIETTMSFTPDAMTVFQGDILSLPPWCYLSKKGIYNDYLKSYTSKGKLVALLKKIKKTSFSVEEAMRYNMPKLSLEKLIKDGVLIKENYIK